MSVTGDVVRQRRKACDYSQAQLAKLVGTDQKTVSRWETGESEPTVSELVRLSDVLDVSLNTLAGKTPSGLDFSGDWWYSGQAFGDTAERIDSLELRIEQDGQWLQLAGARARPVAEGSYAWTGEMKLYDSEAFMGWYVAADGSVRSKGTLYFELHPHGQMMRGMWAGQSYVGSVVHGWCAVARERATSEALIRDMARTQGHLKTWPNLNKS
ncbi:helix-turn-helix domain-containing protein [Nocardia vermiculata]|uniref:Helix-turn-helix transcriptional regulator n=1 Tax=Nocardia vermiculata TaxID=257274 RepID=A0A846Y3P4_9NOCA|nr:helix-turn-helix transcriptional regulator [Nocardia vermiculata]NKY52474.1 helix-turn-helix transcriptional regulator [Nocardia vermiculata]